MMEITIAETGGVRHANLFGRIDSTTAPEAENILRSFAGEQERNVIVNCDGLEYISSGGLRILLVIEKELKGSGRHVILCGLRTEVEKIFRLTGFTSIFTIEKTVTDAVAHHR
ncbi:STAS domain-containing protein [Methanocalculus sp. MC3]